MPCWVPDELPWLRVVQVDKMEKRALVEAAVTASASGSHAMQPQLVERIDLLLQENELLVAQQEVSCLWARLPGAD